MKYHLPEVNNAAYPRYQEAEESTQDIKQTIVELKLSYNNINPWTDVSTNNWHPKVLIMLHCFYFRLISIHTRDVQK